MYVLIQEIVFSIKERRQNLFFSPFSLCFLCFSQNLLKSTGAAGKPTVFLITDSQIKEESFLEDIDSLLNTGEVPNLFATDEKAEIMEVGAVNSLPMADG